MDDGEGIMRRLCALLVPFLCGFGLWSLLDPATFGERVVAVLLTPCAVACGCALALRIDPRIRNGSPKS